MGNGHRQRRGRQRPGQRPTRRQVPARRRSVRDTRRHHHRSQLDGKTDKSTVALDKGESRAIQLEVTEGGGGSGEPDGSQDGGTDGGTHVSTRGLKPKTLVLIVGGGLTLVAVGSWFYFHSAKRRAATDADDLATQVGRNAAAAALRSKCADLGADRSSKECSETCPRSRST